VEQILQTTRKKITKEGQIFKRGTRYLLRWNKYLPSGKKIHRKGTNTRVEQVFTKRE
jgi:hypothetical protein